MSTDQGNTKLSTEPRRHARVVLPVISMSNVYRPFQSDGKCRIFVGKEKALTMGESNTFFHGTKWQFKLVPTQRIRTWTSTFVEREFTYAKYMHSSTPNHLDTTYHVIMYRQQIHTSRTFTWKETRIGFFFPPHLQTLSLIWTQASCRAARPTLVLLTERGRKGGKDGSIEAERTLDTNRIAMQLHCQRLSVQQRQPLEQII